jgi:hypothetical protein
MKSHPRFVLSLMMLALASAACNGGTTTTSPASSSISPPTATETFAGTLPVGGTAFYSFKVLLNGTVNVTLVSVTGTDVDPAVSLELNVGQPNGTGCSTLTVVNVQAGVSTPQLSLTEAPGRYCARLQDLGTLVAPATFTITIDHS